LAGFNKIFGLFYRRSLVLATL